MNLPTCVYRSDEQDDGTAICVCPSLLGPDRIRVSQCPLCPFSDAPDGLVTIDRGRGDDHKVQHRVTYSAGPGGQLKKLLEKLGFVVAWNCSCNQYARLMDARGTGWCRSNTAKIIGWLHGEYGKRKAAGEVFLPFSRKAAGLIVALAIRRAEKAGAHQFCIASPSPRADLAVGMTSAPRVNPTLLDSVESLAAAGFTPTVFAEPHTNLDGLPHWCGVVQRPKRLGAWRNWVDMCRQLLEQGTEYVVTFQDDIFLSPIALEMLDRFPWPANCGALSFYAPAHYYPWEEDEPKWRKVISNSLWGALGLVFKSDDLREMLDLPMAQKWRGAGARAKRLGGEHIGNVDTIIGKMINDQKGRRLYTHIPSLGQHIATHSAMEHGGNDGNRRARSVLMSIPNNDPDFGRTILPPRPRPEDSGTDYWKQRQSYRYYKTVRELVQPAETLLDVGGGVTLGCRYLMGYGTFQQKTSVEKVNPGDTESCPGVELIDADFLDWEPPGQYDTVLCLSCLSGVEEPRVFAQKLFSVARKQVVLAIPYRWKVNPGQLHGGLDEQSLLDWTGREPDTIKVVAEKGKVKRIVASYLLPAHQDVADR